MVELSFDIMGNERKVKVIPESKKLWFSWNDLISCYELSCNDVYLADSQLKFKKIDNETFVSKKGLRKYLLKVYRRRENLLIKRFAEIEKGIYPTVKETLKFQVNELKKRNKV